MNWRPLCGLLPVLAALGPLGCESNRAYRVKVETPFGVVWLRKPAPEEEEGKAGGELPPEQSARVCVATAEALAKQGQVTLAVTRYERAREIDPAVKVARRLAALYERQGHTEKALTEYRRALREGARDAALFADLGSCYYRQGDYREAESWLRQAVAVNPACDWAWVNLSLALGQQERYEESCNALAHAVRPAKARANGAAVLAEEGQLEEAKGSLRKALEKEPDLQLAQVLLAVLEPSPTGGAPARPAQATPAAHFTISHKPSPKDEDGPWLPDLAE
jgi:tetratricopeptide (TPR) repeat protein